jgi:hypothetical protein
MKRTITIEVSKTIQIKQFEPVSVKVSETIQLTDDMDATEARTDLYKDVTRAVTKYIDNEQLKYEAKAKKK